MSEIRSPRLLDASLAEKARLTPSALSLELSMQDTSQASMTLAEGDAVIGMHDFVELYTPNGSAGIYRVTSVKQEYTKEISLSLLHAIDVLTDQIYPGTLEYSGTVAGFLTEVLSRQTTTIGGQACWALGVCQDAGNYVASVSYDSLRSLLKGLQDHEQEYYFTYDFSTFPWQLNLLQRDNTVASEFRLTRNIQNCTISMDDSDMCTRLYLSVDVDTYNTETGVKTTTTTVQVYDDTTAQAQYGIIAKTASINTTDYPDPAAFAARFLADRKRPHVQIEIDGYELAQITGDTFDELQIGRICRVALPDYNLTAMERVVSCSYPDLVMDPSHVTVELASAAYSAVSAIASVAQTAESTAVAQAETAKTVASQIHTTKLNLILTDGVLHSAGIEIDPQDGVFLFAKTQGALGQSLSFVDLGHTGTRLMFADAFEMDANGKLVVKSASGMAYRKNNVEVGLWDNDNLTAGVLVQKINDGSTSVKISADHIELDGDTVASVLFGKSVTLADLSVSNSAQFDCDVGILDDLTVGADLTVQGDLTVGTKQASWQATSVVTSATITLPSFTLTETHIFAQTNAQDSGITGHWAGKLVTGSTAGSVSVTTKTLNYLGGAPT